MWRRRAKRKRQIWIAAAGVGIGLAGSYAVRQLRDPDWSGKVVLITGGSRGLGYLLANEFSRQGCRLVICARDTTELDQAREELESRGADVLAVRCDVSVRRQVEDMIQLAESHFGRIDCVVNNASIIQVGPVETMTIEDFEYAMGINFWGVVYTTMAVLPSMMARREGTIVNITSIGGKVGVPHLIPYTCAKFAAVGFSEALRAEVHSKGVNVVTIVPGMMRTGSFLNAMFKGRQHDESTWFGLTASLPGLSMSADRAARRIVRAAKRGEAECILTMPANFLARLHGLFPTLGIRQMRLMNDAILPSAEGGSRELVRGQDIHNGPPSPVLEKLTTLGREAGKRLHQIH